jgi:DNA end-binding protein Ku
MAPRPYWKGYLKLSLVSCPVMLYPASTQAEKTHFHQINTRTGNRLRQQMVDEDTGRVVDSEHKGRGYELSKGRYVAIDEDELRAVQLESTHTIEIDSFVPHDEIDLRYIVKPYYIVADGSSGEEAYCVIRDAMRDKGRSALARVVMAHREHVIAIQPFDKGLVGTTLRYPYEVRSAKSYFSHLPSRKMPKDMVSLAAHILQSKSAHFDPSHFKDRYEDALKALIRRKAKGKPIAPPAEPEAASNVISLMDALRQSARGAKRGGGAAQRKAPRRSTSARKKPRKSARKAA